MKLPFAKQIAGWVAKTLDIQAWLQGADVDDYDKLKGAELRSPYTQSAWVYIAISVLAENVAQIPFRICKVPRSAERDMQRNPRRFGKSFRNG